ncbi:MAG: hypothetical protein ACT4OG_05990 [Alphaproteobacteria bacterium]
MAPYKTHTVSAGDSENSTSFGIVVWALLLAAGFFSFAPFLTSYVQ